MTFLDGLSIPTSQVTGAADVAAPLTWACSDADLHWHMRLVLEQLCGDKTRTADDAGHGAETFVFTRESTTALMHMEQTGPSAGTVRPATMAEAADRLRLMRERFGHIKQGLTVSMERDWGDGPDACIQGADELVRSVVHDFGFTVPAGISNMAGRVNHPTAIVRAARIVQSPPDEGSTHDEMITTVLGMSPPPPDAAL